MKTKPIKVQQAHAQTIDEIANLMGWMQQELDREQKNKDIGWDNVGSLKHVKENLMETLSFISGISEDDINENLDIINL